MAATQKTYTAKDVKEGNYDILDVFGYVVDNPLPFRIVGFDETDVDGVYTAFRFCAETLEDAKAARRWCEGPVFGVYQHQGAGKWELVVSGLKT